MNPRFQQKKYKGLTIASLSHEPGLYHAYVSEGGFNDVIGYNRAKIVAFLKAEIAAMPKSEREALICANKVELEDILGSVSPALKVADGVPTSKGV